MRSAEEKNEFYLRGFTEKVMYHSNYMICIMFPLRIGGIYTLFDHGSSTPLNLKNCLKFAGN